MRHVTAMWAFVATAVCASAPALAQQPASPPPSPTVTVVGEASVSTLPDIATVSYTVRGEGVTSDAAVREMAEHSRRIEAALVQLAAARIIVRTGAVSVGPARSASCRSDDDQPSPSSGECAVIGYVASLDAAAQMTPEIVGTAAGVASRLGAESAQAGSFALAAPQSARNRAYVAAVADARERATVLATASGARLGPILRLQSDDTGALEDIVVTARRRSAAGDTAPPPVAVDLHPQPVVTRSRVTASFELLR